MTISRRQFITAVGVGAGAAAVPFLAKGDDVSLEELQSIANELQENAVECFQVGKEYSVLVKYYDRVTDLYEELPPIAVQRQAINRMFQIIPESMIDQAKILKICDLRPEQNASDPLKQPGYYGFAFMVPS